MSQQSPPPESLFAAAVLAAPSPAAAVQVTWYVTGHMAAALPGTPAALLAVAPVGAVFTASFSFDSASAGNPIYFTRREPTSSRAAPSAQPRWT